MPSAKGTDKEKKPTTEAHDVADGGAVQSAVPPPSFGAHSVMPFLLVIAAVFVGLLILGALVTPSGAYTGGHGGTRGGLSVGGGALTVPPIVNQCWAFELDETANDVAIYMPLHAQWLWLQALAPGTPNAALPLVQLLKSGTPQNTAYSSAAEALAPLFRMSASYTGGGAFPRALMCRLASGCSAPSLYQALDSDTGFSLLSDGWSSYPVTGMDDQSVIWPQECSCLAFS